MAGAIYNSKKFKGASIQGKIAKGLAKGGVVFWRSYDSATLAIIAFANANGYTLPTNMLAFDTLIRDLKTADIWNDMDRLWLFTGDGSTNFKRINLIDPNKTLATFNGGLTIGNSGIQGNGTNAYIDTNFNPFLLETGQKYQLNDANRLVVIASEQSNARIDGVQSNTINQMVNGVLKSNRINQGSNSTVDDIDYTGTGLKVINRTSASNVNAINKSAQTLTTATSTAIVNNTQLILRSMSVYSTFIVQCYGMGKALTYDKSQLFRTAFNKYLTAIGQTAIA